MMDAWLGTVIVVISAVVCIGSCLLALGLMGYAEWLGRKLGL